MDKYGTEQDLYCYPGTAVLRNKLNITDETALAAAERDLTEIAAQTIEFRPPPYDLQFLKELHLTLFADLFHWAGQTRSVDVAKGETRFCTASRIEPEAEKLFKKLSRKHWLTGLNRKELISEIAELCGDLNMLHPFREGNGRAMRLFCDFIVINAGFEVDWTEVDSGLWLQASINSVQCDYRAMQEVFEICIGDQLLP